MGAYCTSIFCGKGCQQSQQRKRNELTRKGMKEKDELHNASSVSASVAISADRDFCWHRHFVGENVHILLRVFV